MNNNQCVKEKSHLHIRLHYVKHVLLQRFLVQYCSVLCMKTVIHGLVKLRKICISVLTRYVISSLTIHHMR